MEPTPEPIAKRNLHIFELNDFCLIEICKYLNLEDYLRLYKTHSIFHKYIAGALLSQCITIDKRIMEKYTHWKIEEFFKIFGIHINGLCLQNCDLLYWETIVQHCSTGNLKNCEIHGGEFVEMLQQENLMKIFFGQLKTLVLQNTNIGVTTFKTLISYNSGELKELIVCHNDTNHGRNVDNQPTVIQNADLMQRIILLDLEKLQLKCPFTLSKEEVDGLPTSLTVNDLVLSKLCGENISIIQHFPQIERLNLNNFRMYNELVTETILGLKNLKYLTLDGFNWSSEAEQRAEFQLLLYKLAKVNRLEKLVLFVDEEVFSEAVFSNICKMTNLKTLRLLMNCQAIKPYLPNIAQCLKKLREFKFLYSFAVKYVEFESIVCGFIEIAENMRVLHLRMPPFFDWYTKVYAKLTKIREKQNNTNVLIVTMHDNYQRSSMVECKNKYVKMFYPTKKSRLGR